MQKNRGTVGSSLVSNTYRMGGLRNGTSNVSPEESIGKALLTTNLGHVQEDNSSRALDYRYSLWHLHSILIIKDDILNRLHHR